MDKIDVEKFANLEKIGEGKCANIYRNGSIVYKILKENSDSKRFYSKEMLQQLVGVKSDLCVFPNEILEDNEGNLLGYSMDLVSGRKMKDIIAMLSFEQLQSVIAKAEHDVGEISKQGIIFDDIHDDNVMWNEETQRIQIIDTDFFKKTENNPNLDNINYQRFARTIQYMIDSRIDRYGKTENEELIPFYDLTSLKNKDGKQLSINEYILNLKSSIENDFGRQFNNLNEIEVALQEKQDEFEEKQHMEQVANNLTIKEKFIRFLAQSKHIKKLSFINKLIDRQIKMLPTDVQEVVNQSRVDDFQEQPQKANDTDERKKFIQKLRNYSPYITTENLKQVDVSEIDLKNSYFHFTGKKNLERISREGLKPQIGGASKMKNEEQSRVYLSRGGKGIIEIKNSFIHEFKKLRVCDIPEEYRRYFDIKDYSSQEQVDEKAVYDAMEKRFKDEIYFQVSAKEGEDFLIEDQYDGVFAEDFSRENLREMFEQRPARDIKGKANHTISPEQLTRLSTEKGDTAFDIVNYLYNRLLENAKKVGKENSVKWANSDLNSFFEYIKQREIDAGERF